MELTKNSSTKRKCDWISSSFDELSKKPASKNSTAKQKEGENIKVEENHHFVKDTKSFDQWTEKYKPQTISDLAVHRKKVAEVEQWLNNHFCVGDQNKGAAGLLLLTGPSGSGKTATINVLAGQMKFELKEWINPTAQEYQERSSSNWREFSVVQDSQSQQFSDFLLRANRYNQVAVIGKIKNENYREKVVLVEDLPNFAMHKPEKFHTILREYLATGRSPVVIIMSDGHHSESVHAIFPRHVQIMLNIKVISFNSVSMTALTKTMCSIVEKEANLHSSYMTLPSKDTYSMLATASNGDIRSCINSLQFFCTNCCSMKNRTVNNDKSNLKGKKFKTFDMRKDVSKDLINGRDSSLFLFRALGKILYCKRLAEEEHCAFQLSSSHKSFVRRTLSLDPEDVFMRTQITSEMFLLYIHENYPDFFNSMDDIACASDYLCDADVMNSLWAANAAMCDYSASVGMRGVMFANTQVQSNSGSVAGGWRPLHKPEWFQRFKTMNSRLKHFGVIQAEKSHPAIELFTEVLPYKAKCEYRPNILHSFEKDIACFKFSRHPPRISLGTVRDDYNYVDEFKIDDFSNQMENHQHSVDVSRHDLLDEEEEIEDFDD